MDKLLAGDDAGAKASFEAALGDPDDAARAQAELDELAMREARDRIESDPAGALAIYQALLDKDPDNHRARMGVGRVHELERRFDEAITVLSANPRCKSCERQLGETYELRGRQKMANGDYEGAVADYEKAKTYGESAELLIDVSEMYTVGHHGSAIEAARALQQAAPLISHQNTTLQELWSLERRELATYAAAHGEFEAVDLALSLTDPSVAFDGDSREHLLLDLQMDVAGVYQDHQEFARGLALGKATLKRAEAVLKPEKLPLYRERVMTLYSRYAHHLMAIGEARQAIELLTEALVLEPEHPTVRYQAVLAMAAIDQDIAEQMIANIPADREHWARVHAIVRTSRAQHHLADQNIELAQQELFAAGKEYPDLLEVRLVRAEILAGSNVELGRKDARQLNKRGAVKYPHAEAKRYGEALAEVRWVRARFEEEAAQLDPLRMPGFGARLSTLEADITAFYPFAVRKLPNAEPRIVFANAGAQPVELEVEGPGIDETLELLPGKKSTLVFEAPGLVTWLRVDAEDADEVTLLAENRTLIEVPIGGSPKAADEGKAKGN